MTTAAPAQPRLRPIPGRIGAVLTVLHALIAHARHFAASAAARAAAPEFATVAAAFGTYDIPVILHRVQRGILRALALQRYLLARAQRGRNLRFAWPQYADVQPHHRPPPRPAPTPDPAHAPKRPPRPAYDDPAASRLPTQQELDAWVRRRPVGRTMADICLDLGIVPGFCAGEFWNRINNVLRRYGGSLNRMYQIRAQREASFQRERDARPDTWHIDWQDMRISTVRAALGCLIGEAVPPYAPIPGLPATVPS